MEITPPNAVWTSNDGSEYKPSWKRERKFINQEHAEIWDKMKDFPDCQKSQESQKLYEMAYYNGQVILEIGVHGGRSAVIELRGALAAGFCAPPQYYGVDGDPASLKCSLASVEAVRAQDHCLFYHGNLRQFITDLPIIPTMVFMDGDHEYSGCVDDLRRLTTFLAPGTPLLCHGYDVHVGVRRAVDEILGTPFFRHLGLFAGDILLGATEACPGRPRALMPDSFQRARKRLLARYERALAPGSGAGRQTDVSDLVRDARDELLNRSQGGSGRGAWPWSAHTVAPLPATLPGGKPWPPISIITPSFNQGGYIEQTILSVANQGYPNVEHIIIDGGSTDGTVSVLEKHSAHLAFWVSEKDRGQSHAINKGFARAKGEIVTWLNSDDLLAPGALAAVALAFHDSGADLVAGIAQMDREGDTSLQHLTSCPDGVIKLDELLDIENRWFAGQFFYQPEVMFTRELLNRVGGGVNEEMFWSMDYELWFRFAQAGAKLKVIGRPVAQYRVHDKQKTSDEEGFMRELREFVSRHRPGRDVPPPAAMPKSRRLRIALLNDMGFHHGAGIAHGRIAQALLLAGHEVVPIAVARGTLDERQKLKPFSDQILPRLKAIAPDVVVLGNLHGAELDPDIIGRIADLFPTIHVLHDLWLLSGRCAYRGQCEKNLTGCDESCPTPTQYPSLRPDLIRPAWQKKMNLLKTARPLVLAANSRWTADQIGLVASAIHAGPDAPSARPAVIRYGVPLDVFQPRTPSVCRELLGLPQDKFIILFSCSNLGDERKGASHLVEALQRLNLPDLVPVAIGFNDGSARLDLPGLISVGYLTDPRQQAMLFSAADLFVGPSLEEAFGQVFIEAAACGTPSVAYPVGGVREAIRNGVSGRLAVEVTPLSLAAAIEELYWNPNQRRDLALWGRLWVENEFSLEISSHSLTFALRQALNLAARDLAQKLQFTVGDDAVPEPAVLFEELGYSEKPQHRNSASGIDPLELRNDERIERQMLKYYERRLDGYRKRGGAPWFLRPRAWLDRISRDVLRKKLGRASGEGPAP